VHCQKDYENQMRKGFKQVSPCVHFNYIHKKIDGACSQKQGDN